MKPDFWQPILPVVFALLFSATAGADETGMIDSIIQPLQSAVYNQVLDEDAVLRLYTQTLAELDTVSNHIARQRGAALTNYYLGRFYHAIENLDDMVAYARDMRANRFLALRAYYTRRKPALDAYRKALTHAEEFFDLEPNAESHRLLGEIQGQMLFLGTVGEALSLGPKARRHVQEARTLDPDNIKALIQEASRLAYTPDIYGGNSQDARKLYREALRKSNADDEDLFNIYCGFAMASFQEKNDETATNWWKEALKIYPGNIFAGGMLIFCEREEK